LALVTTGTLTAATPLSGRSGVLQAASEDASAMRMIFERIVISFPVRRRFTA
jgi:hypothetical protein